MQVKLIDAGFICKWSKNHWRKNIFWNRMNINKIFLINMNVLIYVALCYKSKVWKIIKNHTKFVLHLFIYLSITVRYNLTTVCNNLRYLKKEITTKHIKLRLIYYDKWMPLEIPVTFPKYHHLSLSQYASIHWYINNIEILQYIFKFCYTSI